MPLMLCLTQDNLKKQKTGSELNVQHNEMLKITITYIYIVNWFSTRVPKPLNWERTGFSTNSAGRTGYHMQKKEFGCPPLIIYKN